MSTYAVYRIWCGVLRQEWKNAKDDPGLQAMDNLTGIEVDGLRFDNQYMNGEWIGFGSVIRELDWTTEDELAEKNLYEPSADTEAVESLEKVKKIFADRGISLEPKLYHLLDLGG